MNNLCRPSQIIPTLSLVVVLTSIIAAHAQRPIASRPDSKPAQRPDLIVQLGHVGGVLNLAISQDGRLMLTGGDFLVFLWSVNTGQIIRQFGGNTRPIAVAFSPDDRYVLTGGMDNMAHLWEATTGREIKKFTGHKERILGVAYSPDGRTILTRSVDQTVRLWDVKSGRELRKFVDLEECFSAFYSPNGRSVLTGGIVDGNPIVTLWSLADGKPVRRFAGGVYGTFSPDGRYVLAVAETTRMYETETGKQVQEFKGSAKVLFSPPDGRYVLTPAEFTGVRGIDTTTGQRIGVSNTAHLWDAASGRLVREFVTRDEVSAAAFTPDGTALLLGTERRLTHMFDVATGKEIRRFDGFADYVREARFSPDGQSMTTQSVDSYTEEAMGYEQITSIVNALWDFSSGQQVRRYVVRRGDDAEARKSSLQPCASEVVLEASQYSPFDFSPDGNLIVMGDCGYARLLDARTGRELRRFEDFKGRVNFISFSPDGQTVALASAASESPRLFQVKTGAESKLEILKDDPRLKDAKPGPIMRFVRGGFIAFTMGSDQDSGRAFRWNAKTWKYAGWIRLSEHVTFSSDYAKVLIEKPGEGSATLRDTMHLQKDVKTFTRKPAKDEDSDDEESEMEIMDRKLSPDGRFMATGSVHYTDNINPHGQRHLQLCLIDVETGKQLRCLDERVTSFTFTPNSRFLITSGYDRTTRLWDVTTLQEVCRLLSFRDGTWVVVTPDGRFETNNLENIPGLHWIFADEPLRPLPLEIFLRDYFEPRLLPRILAGAEFRPIRPLASLNRAQPQVAIVDVQLEPGTTDRAAIKVEISRPSDRPGTGSQRESEAYDLHLFRDGQLVGRWPETDTEPATSNLDLNAWRRTHAIQLDAGTGKASYTFHHVQLPRQPGRRVQFSAYAFNSDRVKSVTSAPSELIVSGGTPPARPRAYLITVGVNANESDWNLDFAVPSARDIQKSVIERVKAKYEVVDVQLLSSLYPDSPRIAVKTATKANIQAVLDLLAGRSVSEQQRAAFDPQSRLRRATPDDLVLLFISSHGYADPAGNFFVIPADTGEPQGVSERVLNDCLSQKVTRDCEAAKDFLQRAVSSDDLARWWKGVDAGDMIMILDSCHSAAVPGREFRPGPLGDRGLGQLSYNKGMHILTATQPDKTARATLLTGIGHSLLTEALITSSSVLTDGTISRWLEESERRVPNLYRELYPTVSTDEIQQPMLLDFSNRKRAPVTIPKDKR